MNRLLKFTLVLIALFLASCAHSAPMVEPTASPFQPTLQQPLTATPSSPTQTAIPNPTRTPNPFPNPVLKVIGAEEVVFDWSTDRCEKENIPDLAARAFHDDMNQVHLVISHYVNYQMIGPDLNNVAPDCSPILKSDYNADPSIYDDAEWLASPYTEDGKTIYALVHNEYRGHTHPGVCPNGDYFDCLDTSLTLAVSTDSGKTYNEVGNPPEHLVSALPYKYQAGAGPFGIRNPSNIIKGKDGYYYSFSNVSQYETEDQWVCLMRSDNLSNPRSWRFWDGSGFNGQFFNPYIGAPSNSTAQECAKLQWDNIGASLNDSITYNTYLNRYVLIGLSADQIGGKEVWGFYYSFSDDMLHWTRRKLLAQMPLPWTVSNAGTDMSVLYPSLLDPNSEARNFDVTGKTAYLYFTRMNHGAGSLDRNLIRVPVEFFPSP